MWGAKQCILLAATKETLGGWTECKTGGENVTFIDIVNTEEVSLEEKM